MSDDAPVITDLIRGFPVTDAEREQLDRDAEEARLALHLSQLPPHRLVEIVYENNSGELRLLAQVDSPRGNRGDLVSFVHGVTEVFVAPPVESEITFEGLSPSVTGPQESEPSDEE